MITSCLLLLLATAAPIAAVSNDVRIADLAQRGDLAGIRALLAPELEKIEAAKAADLKARENNPEKTSEVPDNPHNPDDSDKAAKELKLKSEDLESIRALPVNQPQGDGMTALHWAVYHDDAEMIELLLKVKADVGAVTRTGGITPLYLASKNGSAAAIRALVEAKADPNHLTDTGNSPLMAAAMVGDTNSIKELLDHNADVNARENHYAQTPLMLAAWENRPEAIKLLIERGAHTELMSTVLPLVETRKRADGRPLPRREGREQSGGNSAMGGMTALLFAARDGHMDAVKALLQGGADIDRVSGGDVSSPLVIAIANGHQTLAQYLLDEGADPRKANLDGLTAVWATVNMRFAPVSWAPNPRTDQEHVDSLDLLRSLLEAGADPNARVERKLWFSPTSHDRGWVAHSGSTPFWRAAMSSDLETMRILVAAGADPNLASTGGATPLMVASGLGWIGNFSQNAPHSFLEAAKYCVELGNDVNAVDESGFTALHGAASRGDDELIKYLVDQGAKTDLIDKDGNSAADMAFGPSRFFIPRPETAELLVSFGSPFQNNCRSDQCVDGKFLGGAVAR